jgi:hypothetical protein
MHGPISIGGVDDFGWWRGSKRRHAEGWMVGLMLEQLMQL